MPTILPLDVNGNVIPAVRLKDNGAHALNVGDTSSRNATAFDVSTGIISLYATGPVYIAFGDDAVTATSADHYFPGGIYYDFAIGGGASRQTSHVAVLRVETDCMLYVSEKE